jgi:pyruvate/2-oxoglutarate dehydrogenase complex dihydrolipoamide acyltransferase (E2) component
MSITIEMPILGGVGSSVVLSHWFKKVGDRVEVGDAVIPSQGGRVY